MVALIQAVVKKALNASLGFQVSHSLAANVLNNFKLQEKAVPKIQTASVNSVTLLDFLERKVYALTKPLVALEIKQLQV